MKARIEVILRKEIFDPQGKTIMNALHHMDYKSVTDVKAGKVFYVEMNQSDKNKALKDLEEMSHQLFANPVIENYKISFEEE